MSDLYKQVRDLIQRAEAAAYERGKADAKRELLAYLGGSPIASNLKPSLISGASVSSEDTSGKAGGQDRQRAPRGIVRKLVTRVMREHGNLGITPAQFIEHAATDGERMVRPASVRSELRTGKKFGRYRVDGGLWFLARDDEENEETETPKKDASASLFNQTEGGD